MGPEQRRVASYDRQAWLQIKAEGADIEQRLVATMSCGAAADSQQAMDLAEKHRQHITQWFYDCGYDIHRGLGDLYVNDARFRARYEAIAPGLAPFVRDAHHANANRAAGQS